MTAVNRRQADIGVAVLLASILGLGVVSTLQLNSSVGPMAGQMSTMPAMAAVGPLLMSLVLASLLGGVYVVVRDRIIPASTETTPSTTAPSQGDPDPESPADQPSRESPAPDEILDVLPDDERRILAPVIDAPGITQIKLRDRANFSKSKVSQTLTDLEKRGLLYREPQGRTYRVYPADDLKERL